MAPKAPFLAGVEGARSQESHGGLAYSRESIPSGQGAVDKVREAISQGGDVDRVRPICEAEDA